MLYHPGYIPNTELPAVYSGASVFIYTSLRESYGIPILEAMACGTPVITSTTSAMPEIAGPEGILCLECIRDDTAFFLFLVILPGSDIRL